MMISGLAGARVGPAAVQRKSSVRARAGQSIRMKSSFPVRRAVELATVASAVTPGGAQNGANLRYASFPLDPSNPSRRTRAPFPARGARTVSSSSSSFPGFRQTQEIN